jgi:hypothetical protein
MDKQQKQIIITAGLAVFMVILFMNNLKATKKKSTKAPPKDASASQAAVAPAQAVAATKPAQPAAEGILGAQAERSKLSWGRDPFSSGLENNQQSGELKLQGISFGKDKKGFAHINNEIVTQGDKIGDYEVMGIEKGKVLLQKGSQTFYLSFPNE